MICSAQLNNPYLIYSNCLLTIFTAIDKRGYSFAKSA